MKFPVLTTVRQQDQPTPRPLNVEIAKPINENEIFDLLIMLWEENALFPRTDDFVMRTIQRATEAKGGIIGMIKVEGKLVGTVGVFIDNYWYSEVPYLSEYWNHVHPDYRRSDYAKNLIDFAKWSNEQLGLLLLMGILSTSRTEAKARLYSRRLIPVGHLFANGLPGMDGPVVRDMMNQEPEYAMAGG